MGSASKLNIKLLGSPEILVNDVPVAFDTRKATALLAYLCAMRQPLQRSTLAALLWPESDGSRARSALRRTLATLSKGIGKQWLLTDRTTIALDWERLNSDLWIDVVAFDQFAQSDGAHSADSSTPQASFAQTAINPTGLQQALQLYRGDFLQGFTLSDSIPFDEWQLFQAEQFRQQVIIVTSTLAHDHRQKQQWADALSIGRQWVNLDELSEDAHRLLMIVYTLSGQRSAAIKQYENCHHLLERELGVPPQAETVALFEQIESGELATLPKAAPVRQPVQYRLPTLLKTFVGRRAEIMQIGDLLHNEQCRLVSIIGVGGVGKSRLALEVAQQLKDAYEHGACFVPLEAVESADFLIPSIANALDFTFSGSTTPLSQLQQFLHNKTLLLVLDNLEHLLDGVNELAQLLVAAPQIKLMATSQERLNIGGEWLVSLEGLSVDQSDPLESEAVQLFAERASQVHAAFRLTQDNAPLISEICCLVGGIPLGIELAATWVQLFPLPEIAARITENLDFLVTTLRNVPDRHRSLRAIFEYSWSLLQPDERQLLYRLSIFQRGFTETAATTIANASLMGLMQFMNKSMLRRTELGRFMIPPVLRQYLQEKGDATASNAIHFDHSRYYLQQLAMRSGDLQGSNQKQALLDIAEDIDNIRYAWQWATANQQTALIQNASFGMFLFYERRHWINEAIGAFEAVRHCLPESMYLAYSGALRVRQADYQAGGRLLEACVATADAGSEVMAFANYYLGISAEAAGNAEKALHLQTDAFNQYRRLGNKWTIGNVLNALGNVERAQHNYDDALHHYRESLSLSEQLNDQHGIGLSYHNMAHTFEALGQLDESQALYRKSIAIKRELGDRRGLGFSLNNLGYLCCEQKEHELAMPYLQESMQLFSELGYRRGVGYVLINMGNVMRARGEFEAALQHYSQAKALLAESGDKRGVAYADDALQTLNSNSQIA